MYKSLLTTVVLPLLFGAEISISGCSSPGTTEVPGKLLTHNDFEAVLGWAGSADASVTAEHAHSGTYALRVGPQNEFSYTYIQTLGKMSVAKIKTITVSAWVWLPAQQTPGSLVVAIAHSPTRDTPVFYGSLELGKAIKKAKDWQLVSQTFTLPDSVQATNQLKCYLWRSVGNENIYADDITISAESYPLK